MRRIALVGGMIAALVAVVPAHAADSLAPPGSGRNWLPNDDWVQKHWMPYDQRVLFRYMHMSEDQMRLYFQGGGDTVPPLAAILHKRGTSARTMARRLVRSWHPHVSAHRYAVLMDHATRTLTQGHLIQHLFFHPFHNRAVLKATMQIFNVTPAVMADALTGGESRRQVGHQHGRTDAEMTAATASVLKANEDHGVGLHLTPRSEADVEAASETALIGKWLEESGPGAAMPQHMTGRAASPRASTGPTDWSPVLMSRLGSFTANLLRF